MEKTILHSIIRLQDTKRDIDVNIDTIKVLKDKILRFCIGGELIKKHNNFIVTYKCLTCQRENMLAFNTWLRKMNKGNVHCNTCTTSKQTVSLGSKLIQDQNQFDMMDDVFKNAYFRHHLSKDEFEHIRGKIHSFHHTKFIMNDNFEYWPCVAIPNQSKFCPYIYDKSRDVLEKATYIQYTCDNCGSIFENRDLCIQKNKLKVLCKECGFCNDTCKIRSTKNIQDECISYQSKYELKFIKYCNQNGICVKNGPSIPYTCFQGKPRTYKVDFMIESLGLLIELKDMHCWQKKKIKDDIWEKAALQYASEENMEYKIVFPNNYVKFCKSLCVLVNKI